MAVRPSITYVVDTPQGGMQVGNNNNIIYRNCHITNITHIHTNCKQCHPTEEHDSSQDTSRDLKSASSVHTTTSVRLVDKDGRELELGDYVLTDNYKWSIYAGDGMIITLDEDTQKIVQEPIDVEEPFVSFELREAKYRKRQVVQRAKGEVGQVFDGLNMDFLCWCYMDMTLLEWHNTQM